MNANRTEYHLAHILVSLPEQATLQVLEGRARRAEEALQKVRNGGNFAQLAASYSDARDAMSGGELGWRPASQLPAEFVRELDALKTGGVTPSCARPLACISSSCWTSAPAVSRM